MLRLFAATCVALWLAAAPALGAEEPLELSAVLSVAATEATVGAQLPAVLEIELPAGVTFEPPVLGPQLGSFSVGAGEWTGPEPSGDGSGSTWRWQGTLAAYRTGEQEIPPIRIEASAPGGPTLVGTTEAASVTVRSVLAEDGAELADLKPPASVAADYGPLIKAAVALALLLLVATLLWWLHRRYAQRLAAVPAAEELFRRTPPHEWVYAELQKLLSRRLAEAGEVELFFGELSRILKRYLGGRFRVELMEQTSEEVPRRLGEAGAAQTAVEDMAELLAQSDLVKFAREPVEASDCREAIETAYRIVDATRPRESAAQPAQRGVA